MPAGPVVTETARVPGPGPRGPVPPALRVATTTTISATTISPAAARIAVVRRGAQCGARQGAQRGVRPARPPWGQLFGVTALFSPADTIRCITGG